MDMPTNNSNTRPPSGRELSHSQRERILLAPRSFEAEDTHSIPAVYHEKNVQDLRNTDFVPLHKTLSSACAYGRDGLTSPEVGHQHFTIAGRRASFEGLPWRGPSTLAMAECGMFRLSDNSARCYACDVTFKGLTTHVCIWTRHRQLAPYCCHLKRAGAHGMKNGNVSKMVRRLFSSGDSTGMG